MNTGFFQEMLDAIIVRGREVRDQVAKVAVAGKSKRRLPPRPVNVIARLSRALLSGRGEASGASLAGEVLALYAMLDDAGRRAWFSRLAADYGPDLGGLRAAWRNHERSPTPENFRLLANAMEPPRQELFRRLNRAPGGTAALVAMREHLLSALSGDAALAAVDDDLVHLLRSWFNPGFLILRRIDWSTPADILERIIRYEAVHRIQDWNDLRRRLLPADRRCYAFFHPALIDEPLIFVEVALAKAIPCSIQDLLSEHREIVPAESATTAAFYSISNCQSGLRGISFGNFLIKLVVTELARDLPALKNFVTLSPVPGFGRWLRHIVKDPVAHGLAHVDLAPLASLDAPGWERDPAIAEPLRPLVMQLACVYFLHAKDKRGEPLDPVARFHLGNGARLEHIHWLGDRSDKGIAEACGLMVNYLYDLETIEQNHEAYANLRTISASRAIRSSARQLMVQTSSGKHHVR